MREYIIALIGVAVVCGLIQILAPLSSSGGGDKYLRLLGALCVLCVLISPIGALLKGIGGLEVDIADKIYNEKNEKEKYEEIYNQSIKDHSAQALEKSAEKVLEKELGIGEREVSVKIELCEIDGETSIGGAKAIITPEGVGRDPRDISACVSAYLGCECEIIYK